MDDEKGHDPSTPSKSDMPVYPANVHETLPPGSANSTDNVAVTATVSTLVDIYDSGAIDPAYQAKSHAISCAVQEIGMGKYQVRSPYRI